MPGHPARWPHEKEDVTPKPAMKHMVEGPAAGDKPATKKRRRTIPAVPLRQAIPTAIGYVSLLTLLCFQVVLFLRFPCVS